MDRTEFIAFVTFLLFSAFLLGWVCCWMYQMLTRGTVSDEESVKRISAALTIAEAERDQALDQARQYGAEFDAKLETAMGKYHATLNQLRDAQDIIRKQKARTR